VARVALLDDYQGVALRLADWKSLPAGTEVQVFQDHLADEHALAAANFRLGQYLHARGYAHDAAPYLAEARRLHPESWSYRRQTWELEEPGKAGGAEFWAAVDALGDRPYYQPTVLEP